MRTSVCVAALLSLAVLLHAQSATSKAASAAKRAPSGYDRLLDTINSDLKNARFAHAFTLAQKTIALRPTACQPYLLAAVALYKQDMLDASESYAKEALSRASGPETELVRNVIAAVNAKRRFLELKQEGDSAARSGLKAQAADKYTEAWKLVPTRSDAALDAAKLWVAVGDYAKAAELLSAIVTAQNTDPQIANQAYALRAQHREAFESAFKAALTRASQVYEQSHRLDPAIDSALKLDPTSPEPFLIEARYFATENNREECKRAVLQASKLGATASRALAPIEFGAMFDDPEFVRFATSIYGDSAVLPIQSEHRRRRAAEEQRVAAEAARKTATINRLRALVGRWESNRAVREEWSGGDCSGKASFQRELNIYPSSVDESKLTASGYYSSSRFTSPDTASSIGAAFRGQSCLSTIPRDIVSRTLFYDVGLTCETSDRSRCLLRGTRTNCDPCDGSNREFSLRVEAVGNQLRGKFEDGEEVILSRKD